MRTARTCSFTARGTDMRAVGPNAEKRAPADLDRTRVSAPINSASLGSPVLSATWACAADLDRLLPKKMRGDFSLPLRPALCLDDDEPALVRRFPYQGQETLNGVRQRRGARQQRSNVLDGPYFGRTDAACHVLACG